MYAAKGSNLPPRSKSPVLNHSASGAWRRLGDSNAYVPSGTSPLSRRRTAPVGASNVRKVRDSNPPRCDPVHRFQRCSSTSRSPSTSGETGTRTPDTSRCYTLSRRAPRPAGLSPWSGWPDSNRRPPRPERGALTKLRYNPVGMAGVEPAASEPPARRATAAPHPVAYPRRDSNAHPSGS